MKLLSEADQTQRFNTLMSKIQTAIGGVPRQPAGLLELAAEFGDGGVKPLATQEAMLNQVIRDLQQVRAMMFNLSK